MNKTNLKAIQFLDSINMGFDLGSFEILRDNCVSEMEKSLAGKSASLEMIPTWITADLPVPEDTPCIAVDAGGTNLRIGIVEFKHDKAPRIVTICRMPIPGSVSEVTAADFFETIARPLAPLIKDCGRIGFVFSYSAESLPSHDARAISLAKGICVQGIEGLLLGEQLICALDRIGTNKTKSPHITVLNDTTASLLVTNRYSGERPILPAAFILGTGLNIAYSEASQIINTEIGGADFFPRGECDERIDGASNNPTEHQLEKMISGAYIGPLVTDAVRSAASGRLFSKAANPLLANLPDIASSEINDWISGKLHQSRYATIMQSMTKEDHDFLRTIAVSLINRGALYCAAAMSAALHLENRAIPGARTAVISCNGSTYMKLHGFKNMFEAYLAKWVTEKQGIKINYMYEDEGPMIGAAIAGLTT